MYFEVTLPSKNNKYLFYLLYKTMILQQKVIASDTRKQLYGAFCSVTYKTLS